MIGSYPTVESGLPLNIREARKSAEQKITDIHSNNFLKHGFVRFGPLDHTGTESSRPDPTNIDPSIDRLKAILSNGLLSGYFAQRIGLRLSRNFNDQTNNTYISLINQEGHLSVPFELAVRGAVSRRSETKIPQGNIYTLLLLPLFQTIQRPGMVSSEVLKKRRVAHRFFAGIVFLDTLHVANADKIDSNGFSPEKTTEETLKTMQDIYGTQYEKYFPIYGISGNVYWP